jgi:hypothetical protein
MNNETEMTLATNAGPKTVKAIIFGELAVHEAEPFAAEVQTPAKEPNPHEDDIPRVRLANITHRRTGYAILSGLSWCWALHLAPLLSKLDCWSLNRPENRPDACITSATIQVEVELLYNRLKASDDPEMRKIAKVQKQLWRQQRLQRQASDEAKSIIDEACTPRFTERQGRLRLAGMASYPYEPDLLIRDGKGGIIEQDLAQLPFKQAEAKPAAESDDAEYAARAAKEAELFSAWVTKEQAEGRTEVTLTFGNFVIESGLWFPGGD